MMPIIAADCLKIIFSAICPGLSEHRLFKRFSPFVRSGIAAACLIVTLAGCSRSPRITFYTLQPGVQAGIATANITPPSVAVGPVTLPELVDRPQLVVRVAANRVDILETQRWAEPLKSEIPRLISENLGRLLRSDRVYSYLQNAGFEADYRLLVDIQRFESSPEGTVSVEAVWSLRRATGAAPKTGRSLVHEPVGGEGVDALVAAYGRALFALSRDLAKAIQAESAGVN